jgi:hypothetical protein
MIKLLVFILICRLFSSCIPPNIQLSDNEKILEDSLSKEFKCKITLKHDYKGFVESKKNRSFGVFMCDNLCSIENDSLILLCKKIGYRISKTVRFKDEYKEISFGFIKTKRIDERMEQEECAKLVNVSMYNPDSLIFLNILKPSGPNNPKKNENGIAH